MANAHGELPKAVKGDLKTVNNRAGRLHYYVAGEGPPLLLLHSVNAAASAYEMKPIFEAMKARFTTYALDLPGFGTSDRSRRNYDVRLFVDAVLDMLDVIREGHAEDAVHVVALSLGSEFAARAATEMPARFRSLTLITPTGFTRGSEQLRQPGSTREVPGLSAVFSVPLWRTPLYSLLVSKGSIRYFLERTYGSKSVGDDVVEYAYLTSHRPGAEHAPYAFLSGRLFSKDIRTVYESLTLPVWVAHGTKGDFRDFSDLSWTRTRNNWSVQSFDTGAMMHFEQPDAFFEGFERFLATVAAPADS